MLRDLLSAEGEGTFEFVAAPAAIVFYQAGVDSLREDTLGRLKLTPGGLEQRDRIVFETIRSMGVPAVVTLGGGYADPIERTAEAHARTFVAAARWLAEVAR